MSRNKRRLTIGVAILAVLVAIAVPSYRAMIVRSRESALKLNLASMRSVIQQYTKAKQRPPQSLQDLVDAGYFRELPMDPITKSNSTWKPVVESVVSTGQNVTAITDLHSGSAGVSSDGTAYSTW